MPAQTFYWGELLEFWGVSRPQSPQPVLPEKAIFPLFWPEVRQVVVRLPGKNNGNLSLTVSFGSAARCSVLWMTAENGHRQEEEERCRFSISSDVGRARRLLR